MNLITPAIKSAAENVKLCDMKSDVKGIPDKFELLGIQISAISMEKAVQQAMSWVAEGNRPHLITFTNVHMVTEAYRSPDFMERLRQMDMNCPDGMPLVWLGKMKGNSVSRVCGPEFMPAFCAASASKGYRHFFYGGREGVAEKVAAQLKKESPDLQIAGTFCPPFRELSAEEDLAIVRRINESGADIVWVCLGCPKQEYWISDHQSRLKAGLLLSVGMAFDTISKERQRAHPILRAIGLEWLYRVISEPRRMVGRYYRSNSLFLRLLVREFILGKRHN